MNLCPCCRGRRQITSQKIAPEAHPISTWPPNPDAYVTVQTVVTDCKKCWGTGSGVNYRLVAVRPVDAAWLGAEITRLLDGGSPAEMERDIGTALDYQIWNQVLVGVTIGGKRIEQPYVALRVLKHLAQDVPPDWSIRLVPVELSHKE